MQKKYKGLVVRVTDLEQQVETKADSVQVKKIVNEELMKAQSRKIMTKITKEVMKNSLNFEDGTYQEQIEDVVKSVVEATQPKNKTYEAMRQDMVCTARDVIRDTQEANDRKFNTIIHRLEEEQGMSRENQPKEDIKTVCRILSDIGVTVTNKDIASVKDWAKNG